MTGNDDIAHAQRAGPDVATDRLETCRAMVRQVRIIERALGPRLAGNPELSMLLDVYLADREGRETCLWEVCNAATIPVSTAHRKLARLVAEGHVQRSSPSTDNRRIRLHLAAPTLAALDALMDRLAGLVPAGQAS